MRVLFIDPPGRALGLNIGLGILSAVLKADGHQVAVVDLNNRRESKETDLLKKSIVSFKPELIGISIHATQYVAAQKVITFVRSLSDMPLMAGGPEVSANREKILEECQELDFLVYGEAEETIKEIVKGLAKNTTLENIEGIIFRKNNKIIKNPPRQIIRDINQIPFPDYQVFGVKQIREYHILTSRGCPYNCIFCFSHIGRNWRERKAENVLAELKEAKDKFSIRSFGIWDSIFNLTTEHVVEFCSALIKENLGLSWKCYNVRADAATAEQAKIMRETGCREVYMGVETLDDEIMKRINKKETVKDIRRALDIYHKYGLKVTGFFILGLPGETFYKSLATCERATRMNFDEQGWSYLIPFPETQALEWVKREGNLLMDYRRSANGLMEVVFETKDYPKKERERAMELIQWKLSHWPLVVSPKYPAIFRVILIFRGIFRYDAKNLVRHIRKMFLFITGRIKPDVTNDHKNIIFEETG